MMRVLVYTDASIKEGRGAWATVVLRPDAAPFEAFGALRGRGWRSSTATEAAAMGNALHAAKRAGAIERGDEVVLVCDNLIAVQRINGLIVKTHKVDPMILLAIKTTIGIAAAIGVADLSAQWVKGHQRLDSRDPHMPHNRRCDEICSAIRDGRKPSHSNDLKARMSRAAKLRDEGPARPSASKKRRSNADGIRP